MPWTEITRPHYRRVTRGHARELAAVDWARLPRFEPQPSRLERPRKTDLRRVVDALLYTASSGCRWRQLPRDFPRYSTVQFLYGRAADGALMRITHALIIAAREAAGRGGEFDGWRHRQPIG